MGADGYASSHVGDDEVHILVFSAYGSCISHGLGPGIEHMAASIPFYARKAADLGYFFQFAAHCGIIDI